MPQADECPRLRRSEPTAHPICAILKSVVSLPAPDIRGQRSTVQSKIQNPKSKYSWVIAPLSEFPVIFGPSNAAFSLVAHTNNQSATEVTQKGNEMDTNYIRESGFSNPDTGQFFHEQRQVAGSKRACGALKHCGICDFGFVIPDSPLESVLCLHEDSRYLHETLLPSFTCPLHQRSVAPGPFPLFRCPASPPGHISEASGALLTPPRTSPSESRNQNRIRTDGFSNPDTERLFANPAPAGRPDEENLCGLCRHAHFLPPSEGRWILCLNRKGPHWFETVSSCFTCARHEPRRRRGQPKG